MPLFTSKFSFKKSTPRPVTETRRGVKNRKNELSDSETEEDEESQTSEEEENIEDESSSSLHKDNKEDKIRDKKDGKQITKQRSEKNKKTEKRDVKIPTNDLVLCVDKPQGLVYQFEPKQGVWTSLAVRNRKESIIYLPNKAQDVLESVEQSPQIEQMTQTIKDLEEENRLLKLKIEILMEMVR